MFNCVYVLICFIRYFEHVIHFTIKPPQKSLNKKIKGSPGELVKQAESQLHCNSDWRDLVKTWESTFFHDADVGGQKTTSWATCLASEHGRLWHPTNWSQGPNSVDYWLYDIKQVFFVWKMRMINHTQTLYIIRDKYKYNINMRDKWPKTEVSSQLWTISIEWNTMQPLYTNS